MPRLSRNWICAAAIIVAVFCSSASAGQNGIDLKAIKHAIAEKGAHWTAADNPLLHKSKAELKSLLTDAVPSVSPGDKFFAPDASLALPPSFDWRDNNGNYITPVRNQQGCGSCWDFAAVASLEAQDAIESGFKNPMTDLSEQFILSCGGVGTCAGGACASALGYLVDYGTPDESCLPYSATDASCEGYCSDYESRVIRLKGWSWVTDVNNMDIDIMKKAVVKGPIASWFMVYEDFYAYSTGVYKYVYGAYLGNHFVIIVGWNDDEQAWIAKNSWGPGWGRLGGYFKIKWGEVGFGSWTTSVDAFSRCTGCIIDGSCYSDGQTNPANVCQICLKARSAALWSENDGAHCEDGLWCTVNDTCSGAVCGGEPKNCDDGEVCTTDSCDEAAKRCDHSPNSAKCDDGLYCDGADSCSGGTCSVHAGDPCPAATSCDEYTKQCDPFGSLDDDDSSDSHHDSSSHHTGRCGF